MAPGILLPEDLVMEDAVLQNDSNENQPESHTMSPNSNAQPVQDPTEEGSDKENIRTLEDMFDDEDDEDILNDELMSGAAQEAENQALQLYGGMAPSDEAVMRAFYQRLFPYRPLFQWLNHSIIPCNDFGHREFAFTLQNDAYLRYQSFQSADLLRKQCLQLVPSRFEIGPVYSTNPRDRKSLRNASMFKPLSKELVFDIDMTDYDPIRTCCSGAKICNRCWTFITMSIKVIDIALKDDFGFKHVLWVYSGRRGAHAWVCDRRARELDDSRRRAIAGYLELLKGGDKGGKKVNLKRPLHPHIERSFRILREHFQTDILIEQDPWKDEEKANDLLALLPDKNLNDALRKKWDSAPSRSSAHKWADISDLASKGSSQTLDPKALKEAMQDIVLEYTYPRLDAEVSKKLNHLLKSPFCVHPGTGRICVPIDVRSVEEFDPLTVPTVTELLDEIDRWQGKDDEAGKKIADWEKTTLKPYVDYFKGFVAALLKDEKASKRERDDAVDSMEF